MYAEINTTNPVTKYYVSSNRTWRINTSNRYTEELSSRFFDIQKMNPKYPCC